MKILIVKIGAIGDVVMCLPLVSHIKNKHPNAEITWLCGKTVEELLRETKCIDRLIVVDENKIFGKNIFHKFSEICLIWKKLFLNKYDICLYYYYTNKYKFLIITSLITTTKGFNRNPSRRITPVPGRHHSYEYIWTFEGSNGPFEYHIEYPKLTYINTDIQQIIRSKKDSNNKIIVLAPGGAKNVLREDYMRRWPIEFYINLAKKIILSGKKVILIGSKSDNWVLEHFIELDVINYVGKCSILDTIYILQLGDLLIAHDSGPLHLGDLAGIKSLGLFGPTSPYYFKSLLPFSSYIWGGENLSCRPCYDGKEYAKCLNNICMTDISPDYVFDRAQSMININSL